MSTIYEKIQNQKEVLETIEAVHGFKHAQFVRHSLASTALVAHLPDDLQNPFVLMMMGVLSDLSHAWEIDLSDPTVQERITKDLNSLRAAVA